jgi:NAD(P)-dependent dehydrogenase (short-subunit alcohol dehydrogenase family)
VKKQNKTIIVTGGSRGIGRSISTRLAQAGYDLIITWRTSEQIARETQQAIECTGISCSLVRVDLEKTRLDKFSEELDKNIRSPLYGLVNNAAHIGNRQSNNSISPTDWRTTFEVNLFSVAELCKLVFSRMSYGNGGAGGVIVNISSQVGQYGGNGILAYAASKSALNLLTLGLAREYGPSGIRVNAVSPGIIDSEDEEGRALTPIEKIAEIPLGRLGQPMDVAEAVFWLMSPASSFVSGVVLPVHGAR